MRLEQVGGERYRLVDAVAPVEMFVNGYQSWSWTGWRTVGVDEDPSRHPRSIPFVRDMHHADRAIAREGELRSECVTVLRDATGTCVLVGFLGGSRHDG